ncbi:transglutaminase family protein [Demequina sp. SYSU T00068]|uniref:transglutaminase-like domain-containing protein n=1 Tax=Demequina lignilytica TaxID=3051663 RepID=UPI00260759ED|nr:transglutaminase family protein [Demequina sp. SYSU T00068]MDN4490526.1 transglutaminase family protein [Demequina sp. SYSU T00068]
MIRTVLAELDLDASGPARAILAVTVARGAAVDEELVVEQGGRALAVTEVEDDHGTRLHAVDFEEGPATVRYRATVRGAVEEPAVAGADPVRYLRPSRYAESDVIAPTVADQFGGLEGHALVEAVRAWVHDHVAYTPGSSQPTDGATATILSRQGVCRDFAHLVVAALRASDVPARVVAVYAPGLEPMDFHAVVEALVDGRWWVVDATGLAPRETMVRIATGRDAADTAFLTTIGDAVELTAMRVDAQVDGAPPAAEGPLQLS